MVRVLDATCAADVDSCTEFMNTAANNLTAKANCEDEFNNGLSTVVDAYNGLINYQVMYSAGCLQDRATEQYCYANAVTNTSTSSDAYIYFLPYALALPGSSLPSCSWCNKETMDIFHAATAHRNLPISDTYADAARIFNNLCDPNFVNGTLPQALADSGLALFPSWSIMAASLGLAALFGSLF